MSFLASPSSSPTSFPFVSCAAAAGTAPRCRCRRAATARAPWAALTRPRATPPRAPALPVCADASPAPQHRHRALRRPAWPCHRRAPPLPPHADAGGSARRGAALRGTPRPHRASCAACWSWAWAGEGAAAPCPGRRACHGRGARARTKQGKGATGAGPGLPYKWGPAVSLPPLFHGFQILFIQRIVLNCV